MANEELLQEQEEDWSRVARIEDLARAIIDDDDCQDTTANLLAGIVLSLADLKVGL